MDIRAKRSPIQNIVLLLGAVFIGATASAVVNTKTAFAEVSPVNYSAVKFSEMSLKDKAEIWLLGRGVSKCIGGQGFDHQNHKDSDMKKGQWLESDNREVGEYTADLAEGKSNDSKANCKDIAVKALERMGIDTISALCEMNELGGKTFFKRKNGDCWRGSGDLDFQEGGGDYSDKNTDIWNNLFRKWLGSGESSPGVEESLTSGMRYIIYSEEFYQECSKDHGGSWSVSEWKNGDSEGDHEYKLKWNHENASPDKDWYVVSGGNDNSHGVNIGGYGMLTSDDNLQCKTLAERINGNADAYLGELANSANPDDQQTSENGGKEPPSSTGGTGGGDATQCNIPKTGWIICPVLDTMANIGDQAFGFLSDNFLSVDTELFSTKDAGGGDSGTFAAWKAFRDMANIAFVIAVMVVVYSQLTGAGLSNYGIKKLLPKIVVAAILVNLSYFICQLAVDISNILGATLRDFFKSVAIGLPGGDASTASTSTNIDSPLGWVGIVGVIVVAGTVAWLALGALIPMLVVAIIAMFMILFILLARKALIVLLIALAPLAFVAYLLPNTEQWYKKWQKTFIQLLMVYPIIAIVFGASTLASSIVAASASGADANDNNIMIKIIAAGIAVIPLFVVPGLLKKSIDATGNIGTKLSGIGNKAGKFSGKKAGDRFDKSALGQYKKYRGAEGEKRRALTQAGAYAGRNPLRKGVSRVMGAANNSRLTGQFGDRLAASGVSLADKADNENIAASKTLLASQAIAQENPTDFLSQQFSQASRAGDTVKARAALSALKDQGDGGVEAAQKALAQEVDHGMSDEVSSKLRSHINENHNDLKAKDSRITGWAGSGDRSAIHQTDYSGLTDSQIATQTRGSLLEGRANGTLDDATANRVLGNEKVSGDIKQKQRGVFTGSKADAQRELQEKAYDSYSDNIQP